MYAKLRPMRRPGRGMALPITLFFVLVAFFAATAVLARVHFDAQASVMETTGIQREALARSALATLQARLDKAGTEIGVEPVILEGPGNLRANAWVQQESDEIFRLFAKVNGMGSPYIAQMVVRKKPVVVGLDVVHLNDGEVETSDMLKYRTADSPEWGLLPSPKRALMWVDADRRGNIFAHDFPLLSGRERPGYPLDLIQRFVRANDELVRAGRINHAFTKQVALALESDSEIDFNTVGLGIAPNMGIAANLPQPRPDYIKTAREVADAVSDGASIQHYSMETGEWHSIPVPLPTTSGAVPGRGSSDGKSLYMPVMQPGPDTLKRYDLEKKEWVAMTPPPPLTRPGGPTGPATYGGGATQQLLEVEATDEGKVVAHHGDGNTYGLSVYDPSTNGWSRIPSPPADYIDKDGTRVHLGEEAFAWGNLEVGNEGEIYVVWRTSEEASVRDYEQSQNPGVVGGGPRPPIPVSPGSPGTRPPSIKEAQTSTTLGGEPPLGAETDTDSQSHKVRTQDIIFRYKDGKWTPFRINDPDITRIGKVAGALDGRIMAHDLKPSGQPDRSLVVASDGGVEEVVKVLGLDGDYAEFFAADSGAKPVKGKFEFQETATY